MEAHGIDKTTLKTRGESCILTTRSELGANMRNGKADTALHHEPLVGRYYERSNFLPIPVEKEALARFASERGFGRPTQDEIIFTNFSGFMVLV
jgi:hypothetical protein